MATKRSSRKSKSVFSRFAHSLANSRRAQMLAVMLVFAMIGGGYAAYEALAATQWQQVGGTMQEKIDQYCDNASNNVCAQREGFSGEYAPSIEVYKSVRALKTMDANVRKSVSSGGTYRLCFRIASSYDHSTASINLAWYDSQGGPRQEVRKSISIIKGSPYKQYCTDKVTTSLNGGSSILMSGHFNSGSYSAGDTGKAYIADAVLQKLATN